MHLLLSLFLWILMGSAAAYYAQIRGRDPITWFALGMLLGVIALLLLFFLPQLEQEVVLEEGPVFRSTEESEMPLGLRYWYFVNENGQPEGPLPFHRLRDLYSRGKISTVSLIWSEGMSEWKKIDTQDELQRALKE